MNEPTETNYEYELGKVSIPPTRRLINILWVVAAVAALLAVANSLFFENGRQRFWSAYLVAFAFVLSVSLGSMFFVLVQHLTRAGWSVIVRRPAEVLSLNVIFVAILFLPIGWGVYQGDDVIYSWVGAGSDGTASSSHASGHEESLASDVAVHGAGHAAGAGLLRPAGVLESNSEISDVENRNGGAIRHAAATTTEEAESAGESAGHLPDKPYLTPGRFLIAWLVYFAIWIGIAVFYFSKSVRQDKSGEARLTSQMEWWSGLCTVVFGFAVTYAAFDLLMSLDPGWYSTIFGVYFFAGCAVAGLATLLLVLLLLMRQGIGRELFSGEVQRDLARLLFAFVFFWAYIAFSQYMLLWYANVPETAGWLVRRGMSTATGYTNSWGWLALALLFAHFFIPFAFLMSRHVKSHLTAMIVGTVWMLLIHFLDLYWIVIPQISPELTVSFVEVGTAVAMVALYLIAAIWIASKVGLVPIKDPRLDESLHRQAAY